MASAFTAGIFETFNVYVGERMPLASTKYSVARVRSNTRDVNAPSAESRDIGRRTHSLDESVRNTSSAPSAVKPASAARTSTAAPRGMVALPGVTCTASVVVAASATDHGANSLRAVSRSACGPTANSSAAPTPMTPSERSARIMRGRSSVAPRCKGRTTASVRSTSRAVSEGDARSASGARSSCTAESSDCRSCGARSSTYRANRSSLVRQMSGMIIQRTMAALINA